MRRTFLACILALGLLAVPVALAAGGSPETGKSKMAAHSQRGNHTDDDPRGERGNSSDAKPAWASAFKARLAELRASWHENASKIRAECHAAEKPGNDSSREDRLAWSHCIRDAYKTWFAQFKAEREAAREAARAARDA